MINTPLDSRPIRVVVVGAGRVGSTFAYALVMSGLASEVVLVDRDAERALGEAMDLNHAVPFASATTVRTGTMQDCEDAHIIAITAGVAQRPDESRLEFSRRNASICEGILAELNLHSPTGVIVLASNPVDVLTHLAHRRLAVPTGRIIGSGTVLDTARFQVALGEHYQIDPRSVHAYIIGEHGDSEVPVWSLANVAGMRLPEFCVVHGMGHRQADMDELFARTRDAAYEIIRRKGATHFAIGAGLLRIVRAVLRDERSVLTVSVPVHDSYGLGDVCLSIPCVIGHAGVERRLEVALTTEEEAQLARSAETLKEKIAELESG